MAVSPRVIIDPGSDSFPQWSVQLPRVQGQYGPYSYRGSLYVLLRMLQQGVAPDYANSGPIRIYKSSDGGLTWVQKDAGNGIDINLEEWWDGWQVYASYHAGEDHVHIGCRFGGDTGWKFQTFNFTSDTFSAITAAGAPSSDPTPGEGEEPRFWVPEGFIALADGSYVVLEILNNLPQGSPIPAVDVRHSGVLFWSRWDGESWATTSQGPLFGGTEIEQGRLVPAVEYPSGTVHVLAATGGAYDRPAIYYKDLKYQTIDIAAGSLSSYVDAATEQSYINPSMMIAKDGFLYFLFRVGYDGSVPYGLFIVKLNPTGPTFTPTLISTPGGLNFDLLHGIGDTGVIAHTGSSPWKKACFGSVLGSDFRAVVEWDFFGDLGNYAVTQYQSSDGLTWGAQELAVNADPLVGNELSIGLVRKRGNKGAYFGKPFGSGGAGYFL